MTSERHISDERLAPTNIATGCTVNPLRVFTPQDITIREAAVQTSSPAPMNIVSSWQQ